MFCTRTARRSLYIGSRRQHMVPPPFPLGSGRVVPYRTAEEWDGEEEGRGIWTMRGLLAVMNDDAEEEEEAGQGREGSIGRGRGK